MAKMLANTRDAHVCGKDCAPHFGNDAPTSLKVRYRRMLKRRGRQAWKRETKPHRGGDQ